MIIFYSFEEKNWNTSVAVYCRPTIKCGRCSILTPPTTTKERLKLQLGDGNRIRTTSKLSSICNICFFVFFCLLWFNMVNSSGFFFLCIQFFTCWRILNMTFVPGTFTRTGIWYLLTKYGVFMVRFKKKIAYFKQELEKIASYCSL